MNLQSNLFRHANMSSLQIIPFPYLLMNQNTYILRKLSEALRISVNQFAHIQSSKVTQTERLNQESQNYSQNKPTIIQLISSEEESNTSCSKFNDNLKPFLQEKKTQINEQDDKTYRRQEKKQEIQIQQHSSNNQASSSCVKKTILIKKQKTSKQISKLKKHLSYELQNKMDFSQVVYLKRLPFSRQQLNKKKDSLLKRKVLNWEQTVKGRKQRREIRMLFN